MSEHTFDRQSVAFNDGMTDGYMGFTAQTDVASDVVESYMAGYDAGQLRFADEQASQRDDYYDDYDYWNPVEQGYYDDDPSPYNGDYSEM